jgi:polysaccharide biosynthesis transport protein
VPPDSATDQHNASTELDLSTSLYHLWGILLRRRIIAISVFLIVACTGIALTLKAPKIYEATATLRIEQKTPAILGHSVQNFDSGSNYGYTASLNFYETQYRVISSRPVAEKVVETLGISPEQLIAELQASLPPSVFQEAADNGQNILEGVSEGLRKKLELIHISHRTNGQLLIEELKNCDIPALIKDKIQVDPVEKSRLVHLSIQGRNPENITLIANTVAESYVNLNLAQKRDAAKEAVLWLSDQVLDLRGKLAASELSLHKFQSQNDIISVSLEDRRSILSERLLHLNRALSEATTESINLYSQLKLFKEILKGSEKRLDLSGLSSTSHLDHLQKQISELYQEESDFAQRYTDNHPKLVNVRSRIKRAEEQLTAETLTSINSIEHQYLTQQAIIGKLKLEIETVKQENLEANENSVDHSRLQRDASNNLQLYNLVLRRQKEAQLSQMLKANNVHLLERALPPLTPIKPRRRLAALASLLIALMLAIGLAIAADMVDNTVKSQEHVERLVGAPFLGILPAISKNQSAPESTPTDQTSNSTPREKDHFVLSNPRSSVAECSRTIRTNLFFMSPENPAHTIVVTSNSPQEGKSTVAINLSIAIAQSGKRTLLIDADMRRPRLHKSFGITNDNGLSNLIIGNQKLQDCIVGTEVEGLEILPCGPIPPNPAELLHTENFRTVLKDLKQQYDQIIFDSPPVSPVTDAMILGSILDGVVFIAHAGKTSIPAARRSKRRLEDVGGRILGIVLNNVDLEGRSRSGYYDDQYYYYHRTGYYYEDTATAKQA